MTDGHLLWSAIGFLRQAVRRLTAIDAQLGSPVELVKVMEGVTVLRDTLDRMERGKTN